MRRHVAALAAFVLASLAADGYTQDIRGFRGGVRIPAGSCPTYIEQQGARIASVNGALRVDNPNGPVRVRSVCALPVPEKAKVSRFVMVGNVSIGEIFAYIAQQAGDEPRQVPFFANISLLPSTPFEVPARKQKKVMRNVPASGSEALTIDRINTYFIETEFRAPSAVDAASALELFYFEVYWN